jgi:plasmid stabilization system protein ParE
MAQVNWTFQALEDVEEIAAFHARNSERYASLLVEYFFEGAAQLEKFPLSGRIVP